MLGDELAFKRYLLALWKLTLWYFIRKSKNVTYLMSMRERCDQEPPSKTQKTCCFNIRWAINIRTLVQRINTNMKIYPLFAFEKLGGICYEEIHITLADMGLYPRITLTDMGLYLPHYPGWYELISPHYTDIYELIFTYYTGRYRLIFPHYTGRYEVIFPHYTGWYEAIFRHYTGRYELIFPHYTGRHKLYPHITLVDISYIPTLTWQT